MLDFEREDLNKTGPWACLLDAYLTQQQEMRQEFKQAEKEFTGWVPRLATVEQIEDELLSKLHGRLIAVGFLKFQLGKRTTGLCYQLSPEGRKALDKWNQQASPEDGSEVSNTDDVALTDVA